MSHEELYEQMAETTPISSQQQSGPPASNEGMLQEVHSIGNVARNASRNCRKGKEAARKMDEIQNGPGQ